MTARFKPLPRLEGAQSRAADPQVHAALSASAGTGKTEVLTARVLLLLLQGARPESILCLTFTKAAAAEMANRIMARLAVWVRLKDSELATDLLNLRAANDPPTRRRARQLFARVLDCPGGLRIQTIHAFAQSLLASFPAEAGVVPGFQPIEGRAEQELVRRTLADLVSDAEANRDDQLVADIECLSRRLGEGGAVDYLHACAGRHEALAALGERQTIEPLIRGKMMHLPDGDPEQLLLERCSDDSFDCDLLRRLLDANRQWDTESGRTICANIEEWLASTPQARASGLSKLATRLVTKDFRPFKVSPKQIAVCGDYEELVQQLAVLLQQIEHLRRGLALAADMAAGLRAGQAFAAAYTLAKRSAGVADFNDLIDWTRRLLGKPGMGEWVRYKLDRQVDHILLDEAQDTNAAQWEIIDRLVEEFFTGASEADERWRTLFMVGDFKQSIYRFQGTDPAEFEDARARYRSRAEALIDAEAPLDEAKQRAREFRDLSIGASFRSAQPILDVVDAVIDELGFSAIGLPDEPDRHVAHHADRPGRVELWQPFAVETPDDEADEGEERWIEVRDRLHAEELATRVKDLVDEAPIVGSTRRKLAPGDILILVRSRAELASLVVARLFAKGVPVAGVDRLHLHDPLAVQDLLAAVAFAVQPEDDLSLASLLVSPLIGWDQDELRELAYGREDTLWRELRRRSGENGRFGAAHDALSELLRIADFVTPSRFLETILSGPMQGRRKLYGRLGMASRDPIDELMNSAIEFERNETASLDRFLSWFSRGDVDVQRDPAAPANEVRVMTVHGAKGLQAPVVILADSTADPKKLGRTPVTLDFEIERYGKAPLLRPKKEERLPPFEGMLADEERRDLQEHWRLLYVGLTRAADRLIVSGVAPKPKKDGSDARPENCWHRAVQNAMLSLNAEPVAQGETVKLVYGTDRPISPRRQTLLELASPELPSWTKSPAPPEARPPRPLAPSALAEDRESAPPPSPEQRAAAERGTVIHALLERLPALAQEKREQAGLRWLERSAGIADATAREEIARTVCALIADSRFSALFGPGSLAEAPIAATLPDGRVIAGTVDRLLVEPERVLVVDYKTGRTPESDEQVPHAHRLQMRTYAEALSVIFPGRKVDAALLYTANARFFPISS